ncbi:hypothetical protein SI65_05796 [Aspergillus cristatus]|uniref:Uncharacterized protein n=1 Tax=Aspergillus cristatus TaxID=573508 RepID=A0A1E3BE16_ASPCR|nr:hypothetical protein SI65_05796 [Aspergillus cristatus]
MQLLDLPLEILRVILGETVSTLYCEELIRLQLVNKFFAREVIVATCSTHHFRDSGCWMPFAPYYLQSKALTPSSVNDYSTLTVRDTTNQMVEYLAGDENQRQQLSLAISRAAIEFKAPGIYSSLTNAGTLQPQTSQRSDAQEHLLSAAANIGDLALVQHLAKSVNVKTGSYIFRKLLLNAAWKGHLEIVRFLLTEDSRNGHDENAIEKLSVEFENPRPGTALEAAALCGHEQVARLLFQSDAKVSRSSYSYFKAITYAAMSGNLDLLGLVSEEADFNTLSEITTQELWNHTLKGAAWHGRTKTIPFLLNAGAQINHEELFERGWTTALGFAALRGHNDTIRLLLEKGAAVDGGRRCEEGPISLAAHVHGFPRTVELLLDEGASVRPIKSRLLEQAVMYSPPSVVRVLLEKGVHKRREDGGEAALDIAVDEERQDVVALLKLHGVTLEA